MAAVMTGAIKIDLDMTGILKVIPTLTVCSLAVKFETPLLAWAVFANNRKTLSTQQKCFLKCLFQFWGILSPGGLGHYNLEVAAAFFQSIGLSYNKVKLAESVMYRCYHRDLLGKFTSNQCENAFRMYYCATLRGLAISIFSLSNATVDPGMEHPDIEELSTIPKSSNEPTSTNYFNSSTEDRIVTDTITSDLINTDYTDKGGDKNTSKSQTSVPTVPTSTSNSLKNAMNTNNTGMDTSETELN